MEEEIIMLIKFAYNEPRIGEFEADIPMTEEEMIREIEEQFPEAIDIEIIEYA
jgi:hypothetical protein